MSAAPALAPGDLAWVCELVRAETAVVLDASKEYLVASRLLPLARRGGFRDVAAYVSRMRTASPAERWELVEAMTTNETSWFRDVEPFTHLRDSLLPGLAAARAATRSLRVWSAACSTGQEPYTIAMLLADAPQLRGFRTEVVATDVDRTALERARSGTYSAMEVGRGLPTDMLARHLERAGLQWRVRDGLRAAVRFSELNLARPFPERGRFDVIFCRNVLIYFDTATKRQVLERLHQVLAPDGVLVLGAAETTLGVSGAWARVDGSRAAVYRPLSGHATAPGAPAPARPGAAAAAAGRPWGAPPAGRTTSAPSAPASPSRPGARPAAALPPVAAPRVPASRSALPPRPAVPTRWDVPPRPTTTPARVAPVTSWSPARPPRPPAAPPAGAQLAATPPGAGPARPPAPRRVPAEPAPRAGGRPASPRPVTQRPGSARPDSARPDSGGSR